MRLQNDFIIRYILMLKNIILLSTILLATNAFANVNWSYVGADANASYYVSDIESEVNNFNIKKHKLA